MSSTAVFDRLLQVAVLLQSDLTSSLAGTELTTARAHLLWELSRRGPSTQQALARALDVSARNVTGLVDAVEQAGYAVRKPHPGDRRAVLVTLTELGETAMAGMARDREQAASALLSGFDARRIEELGDDLGIIADRLQTMIDSSRRGSA